MCPTNPLDALDRLAEALDLPTSRDARRAYDRMIEAIDQVRETCGIPTSKDVSDAIDRLDRWWEDLGDQTGLPTYHDVWDTIEDAKEWAKDKARDVLDDLPVDLPDDFPDEDEWSIWPWIGLGVGWVVYRVLSTELEISYDFELEIPGFELDGITVKEERAYVPGPPFAARVGDPMLHAGIAVPGPGVGKVFIGGKPALTSADSTICPMVDPSGTKHSGGPLLSSNDTVFAGGAALVRAGDYAVEIVGGPNPVISGCPTVLAGDRAPPVMVVEFRNKPLWEFVPGLERVGYSGGKVKAKLNVRMELGDAMGYAFAVGLAAGGSGPGAIGVAAVLLDEPKVSFDLEVDTGRVYAETRNDIELPNGETQIVRERVDLGLGTLKAKGSVEPSLPNLSKSKVKIEDAEYTPGSARYQRSIHGADEPPPEWKE